MTDRNRDLQLNSGWLYGNAMAGLGRKVDSVHVLSKVQ